MAREKTETTDAVELDRPDTVASPKFVVTMGRGRTGKSSWIRYVAGRAFDLGRPPVIADADRTNATLAAFFEGVTRPESADADDVREWLNNVLEDQIAANAAGKAFSVLLDLGGGDLVLKEHAKDLSLVPFCEQFGIDPIAVHFLGSDLDDLAYLRDVDESGAFAPKKTLLVLNEGVLPPGRQPGRAFEAVRNHDIFKAAIKRDAKAVMMPRLQCMGEIDRRRLLFSAAAAGTVKAGQEPLGPIARQYTTMWLRAMDAAFTSVSDWLP
jgi:hypothetical protein